MAEVLLVDDEYLAVCGIQKGVNWEKCQVSKVHTAFNAVEARKIIEENSIDVLVCDIEMPGDSGIHLYEWIKENSPDVICIFLSCHAEFDYARDAVELGVFRYLLKPIPYPDLERTIQEALEYGRKQKISRELYENIQIQGQDAEGSLVRKVQQYILEHLDSECSREHIAEAVFINPDYLSRMFKKNTGMGLNDYILRQRISLAIQMLANTEESIGRISEKTGFSYVAYFSKVFKRETGLTPMAYRNQNRTSQ